MLRIRHGLSRQAGFSIAEVIMALTLFAATVLGVAAMMLSGAGNVTRGAMDSTAAALAERKIEEVKTLYFYRPYDPATGNQDIDDYYYRYNGSGILLDNSAQLTTAFSQGEYGFEDYGTISGHPGYKRTTAVQYQYLTSDASQFQTATMETDWVPKNLGPTQFDRPKQKDAPVNQDANIHAIKIEVRTYFRDSTGEHSFVQQTLAGDSLLTGGTANPVLMAQSVEPNTASYSQDDFAVTVKVYAPDLTDDAIIKVGFWYPGKKTVYAKTVSIDGETLNCTFDFATPIYVKPGSYNLEVEWLNEGWVDKTLRECFTVTSPTPRLDSIDNFNWGYYGQTSQRQVTIHGEYLDEPTNIEFKGPGDKTIKTWSVVEESSDRTKVVVLLDLESEASIDPPSPSNQYWNTTWDLRVYTKYGGWCDGSLNDNFTLNPTPVVTSVDLETADSSYDFYRKKRYTNVTLTGRYFSGALSSGQWPQMTLTKGTKTISGNDLVVSKVTETSDTAMAVEYSLNLQLSIHKEGGVLTPGPLTWNGSSTEVGAWDVNVTNWSPNPSKQSATRSGQMGNAKPEITQLQCTNKYKNYYDSDFTVTGKYFDTDTNTDAASTQATRVLVKSGGSEVYTDNIYTVQDDKGDTGAPPLATGVTVAGTYGAAGQTVVGKMNFVKMNTGNYDIIVRDRESGQESTASTLALTNTPAPYVFPGRSCADGASPPSGIRMQWVHYSIPSGQALPFWWGAYPCTFATQDASPWAMAALDHTPHIHYSYFRFKIYGMGFDGTVTIQPGYWTGHWEGFTYVNDWNVGAKTSGGVNIPDAWGTKTATVTADRINRLVYATMDNADSTTWFTCTRTDLKRTAWPFLDKDYAVGVKNSVGGDWGRSHSGNVLFPNEWRLLYQT